ncbi:MAG: methyl-accepting chemotaxis protein [Spongiibacteraceae bacterium]|jgi:methyl-accepting chemotaxis protein|nr:methyl-accepting chemotaxis protein [Spongiibacteraceae bacterium]
MTRQVSEAFAGIEAAISRITTMNTQVATAAEEQTTVVSEIDGNVIAIRDTAATTTASADQLAAANDHLRELVTHLRSLVRQFDDA